MNKKRTIIYIDGYNLYYGLLKGSVCKWLDLFGGRVPGTNDTVKRYSRSDWVTVDSSVRRLRRPVAGG